MEFSKPDENMDPKFLFDFKTVLYSSIKEFMYDPIFGEVNSFLKASLMHPGVDLF